MPCANALKTTLIDNIIHLENRLVSVGSNGNVPSTIAVLSDDSELDDAKEWLETKSVEELAEMVSALIRKIDDRDGSTAECKKDTAAPRMRLTDSTHADNTSPVREIQKGTKAKVFDSSDLSALLFDTSIAPSREHSRRKRASRDQQRLRGKRIPETIFSKEADINRNITSSESHEMEEPESVTQPDHAIRRLESENRRWKRFADHMGKSDSELLSKVANLEESLHIAELKNKTIDKYEPPQQQQPDVTVKPTSTTATVGSSSAPTPVVRVPDADKRGARFYSMQLQDIRYHGIIEDLKKRLQDEKERRCAAEERADRLGQDGDSLQAERNRLLHRLESNKRVENVMKRRVEALEEGRAGERGAGFQIKAAALESENELLVRDLQECKKHLKDVQLKFAESDGMRTLLEEEVSTLQQNDELQNRKFLHLQSSYESMLNDYVEASIHQKTWRRREETYHQLEASLKAKEDETARHVQQLNEEKINLRGQIDRMNVDMACVKQRNHDLETQLQAQKTDVTKELVGFIENKKVSRDELTALRTHNSTLEQRLRVAEETNAARVKALRDAEEQQTSLRYEICELMAKVDQANLRADTLSKTAKALQDEIDRVTNHSDSATCRLSALEVDRQTLSQRLFESEKREELLSRKIKVLTENESDMRQKIMELENESIMLRSIVSKERNESTDDVELTAEKQPDDDEPALLHVDQPNGGMENFEFLPWFSPAEDESHL